MIELIDFTELDFETFISWIKSEEELFQFAGPIFTFPVTNEQLLNYIKMTDKRPLKVVLKKTNETIGHCELNFENGKTKLSRILVGKKEMRGQKIGQKIVEKMTAILFKDPTVKKVELNVFEWNKSAIKCYKNVGFRINHDSTDKMNVNGQIWTRLNMVLIKN